MLVGLRSEEVDEPMTWGTWGGAVDPGEDAEAAVRREVAEETGYEGEMSLSLLHTYRHPSGFGYETFMAGVPREFDPALCCETSEARWINTGRWPEPLHFGLAEVLAARPELLLNTQGTVFRRIFSALRRNAAARHGQ
jgi:8-oxo-dGTP pyrophosphatase MutT (NUDIX family)